MGAFLGYAIAILAIVLIGKIVSFPIRVIIKLIINGLMGGLILFILNFFGDLIGLHVGINVFSALIAGFFGVPGVVFLIILSLF